MGFCLFEHAIDTGLYFAVNASHVSEFAQCDPAVDGRPACLMDFEVSTGNFQALAIGELSDVKDTLMQASKIGLKKAEVQILSGRGNVKATPFIFNNADRIAIVREMFLDEFIPKDFDEFDALDFTTASEAIMEDGKTRIFTNRPALFARSVNAMGHVPILTVKQED